MGWQRVRRTLGARPRHARSGHQWIHGGLAVRARAGSCTFLCHLRLRSAGSLGIPCPTAAFRRCITSLPARCSCTAGHESTGNARVNSDKSSTYSLNVELQIIAGKARPTSVAPRRGEDPAAAAVRMLTVDAESAGQRLDNYLMRLLKGVPKTHVYRVIRSGEVRVNKGRAGADTRVAEGDLIRVPPVRVATPTPSTVPAREFPVDRKSTRLNSSHGMSSRMPSSA